MFVIGIQIGVLNMNKLVSTRNSNYEVNYPEAILKGISKDKGLFVPKSFKKIDFSQEKFLNMSYEEYAFEILQLFLDYLTNEELEQIIAESYRKKFDHEAIVPIKELNNEFNDHAILNRLGYRRLTKEDKPDWALELFKLNVKLFPEDGNLWDSLFEAYLKYGKEEEAIKSYTKAVELGSEGSKKILNELLKKD